MINEHFYNKPKHELADTVYGHERKLWYR